MYYAELVAGIIGLDTTWRIYSYGAALSGFAPDKLIIIEPHYKEVSLTELSMMRDWENTALAHMISRANVVLRLNGPILVRHRDQTDGHNARQAEAGDTVPASLVG